MSKKAQWIMFLVWVVGAAVIVTVLHGYTGTAFGIAYTLALYVALVVGKRRGW
jgi:hypothetical protein